MRYRMERSIDNWRDVWPMDRKSLRKLKGTVRSRGWNNRLAKQTSAGIGRAEKSD